MAAATVIVQVVWLLCRSAPQSGPQLIWLIVALVAFLAAAILVGTFLWQNDWELVRQLWRITDEPVGWCSALVALFTTSLYTSFMWDAPHGATTAATEVVEVTSLLAATVGLPLALAKLYRGRYVFTELDDLLFHLARDIGRCKTATVLYPVPTPGCMTTPRAYDLLYEAIGKATWERHAQVSIGCLSAGQLGSFYRAYLGTSRPESGRYIMEDLYSSAYVPYVRLLALQSALSGSNQVRGHLLIRWTSQPADFAAQLAVVDDTVYTIESFGIPVWDSKVSTFVREESGQVNLCGIRVKNGLVAHEMRERFRQQTGRWRTEGGREQEPVAAPRDATRSLARSKAQRGEFLESLLCLNEVGCIPPSDWTCSDRSSAWRPGEGVPTTGDAAAVAQLFSDMDLLCFYSWTLENASGGSADVALVVFDGDTLQRNDEAYCKAIHEKLTLDDGRVHVRRVRDCIVCVRVRPVSKAETHCTLLAEFYSGLVTACYQGKRPR